VDPVPHGLRPTPSTLRSALLPIAVSLMLAACQENGPGQAGAGPSTLPAQVPPAANTGPGPITGTVYWPDGSPAANVPIAFAPLGPHTRNCCPIVITDGNGVYQSDVCEGPHFSDSADLATRSGCLALEADLYVNAASYPLDGTTRDSPACVIFLVPIGAGTSSGVDVPATGGTINWRVFDGDCGPGNSFLDWQSANNVITAQDAQNLSPVPPSWQQERQALAQGGR
jgi:hypothetical protein